MLSFTPSPKINDQLKRIHDRLAEAGKALEDADASEMAELNRYALISNVGATTRIENAVLTDPEVEWLHTVLTQDGKTTAFEEHRSFIIDKLSKDRERSTEEVAGCLNALTTIYRQAAYLYPLTEATIRGLHKDLLEFHPPAQHYAGRYKTASNQVIAKDHQTGQQRTVLQPTAPGLMTETAMQELVDWYNPAIRECPEPTLVAIEFVFRFLAIHPFQDGNGRMGRALFTLILLQSGDKSLERVIPAIAIDRRIEQDRPQYYAALNRCAGGEYQRDAAKYHYEPLVNFTLRTMRDALADIPIYREKYRIRQQLPVSAEKVLQCFKDNPGMQLKVAQITEQTDIPRRTIQLALKTLTEKSFLQMRGQGAGSRYQLVF